MNKIEELIDKYCPNGIKEVQLESIVDYLQPTKYIVKNDNYDSTCGIPVLTAGKSFILGYTNEKNNVFNAKQDNIILFDDFTCAIQWVDFDFKVKSSATKFLLSKDQSICNLKYVFYWMKNQNIDENTLEHKRHWIQDFSKRMIPLPPLEIQNEIVHILDTFTELITELITELKHRKIQYQYYLDDIFLCLSNPDSKECNTKFSKLIKQLCPNGVEFVKLKDICIINKGKQLNKDKLLDIKEGKYPVMNGGINPSGYWNEYNALSNTITISQGGASAGYINWMNSNFFAGAHCYYLTESVTRINYKFLYYILKNNQENLMNSKHGDAIPGLNKEKIENILIPLPPIGIQNKIINILDQFNDLTNSISLGLPKEIELRKQQYEYYRNKLLTFKQ